jgi:hypothetical protein
MSLREFILMLFFFALLAAAPIILDTVAQAGGAQSFIRQNLNISPEVDCTGEKI